MQIPEELYIIFENYIIRDEDGWEIGLSEDAPQEAKEAYEKFLNARRESGSLEE